MANQVDIGKTRTVVQGILALLGTKVGRTELVKLVYLSDTRFYESTGRTITGNTYMWDHYGPNAVGHAVANEADEMADKSIIRMAVRPSAYDSFAYDYWVDDPNMTWDAIEGLLDSGERQVLMDVAKQYGRLSLASLVRRSKQTKPFSKAKKYGILALEQDKRAQEIRRRLDSTGEFLEEAEAGLRDSEAKKWIEGDNLDAFTRS